MSPLRRLALPAVESRSRGSRKSASESVDAVGRGTPRFGPSLIIRWWGFRRGMAPQARSADLYTGTRSGSSGRGRERNHLTPSTQRSVAGGVPQESSAIVNHTRPGAAAGGRGG